MNRLRESIKDKVLSMIYEGILIIRAIIKVPKGISLDRYECIDCKAIFDKAQICECGSNRFLLNTEKYKMNDFGITCVCEKGKLINVAHYDCEDGFFEEYECSRCKNTISIYEYIEEY